MLAIPSPGPTHPRADEVLMQEIHGRSNGRSNYGTSNYANTYRTPARQ